MASKSKDEVIKEAYEKGYKYEYDKHGGSQPVILAIQEVLGMKDDGVFKAASGLVGGIGLMDDVCSALLGGCLMLGLKYGRELEELDNMKNLAISSEPVGKLYKWFEKEFGSVKCHDVRAKLDGGVFYDLKSPWQFDLAMKAGHQEKCSDIAGKVAAKVVEMILDDEEKKK
jgi:hypothetical protein